MKNPVCWKSTLGNQKIKQNIKIQHTNCNFILNTTNNIISLSDIRIINIAVKLIYKISKLALSKQIPHIPYQV